MILPSLALAMGIALLVPVRMSETPQAMGLVVLAGAGLIAVGCAMQVTALVEGRSRLSGPRRALLVGGSWAAIAAAMWWAIARAPGIELVGLLMTMPTAIGAASVVSASGAERWHGAPFLGLAIALALLLAPVVLSRQGG